jgi:hypothetical protein
MQRNGRPHSSTLLLLAVLMVLAILFGGANAIYG